MKSQMWDIKPQLRATVTVMRKIVNSETQSRSFLRKSQWFKVAIPIYNTRALRNKVRSVSYEVEIMRKSVAIVRYKLKICKIHSCSFSGMWTCHGGCCAAETPLRNQDFIRNSSRVGN